MGNALSSFSCTILSSLTKIDLTRYSSSIHLSGAGHFREICAWVLRSLDTKHVDQIMCVMVYITNRVLQTNMLWYQKPIDFGWDFLLAIHANNDTTFDGPSEIKSEEYNH